jgi:hypothetical protein
VAVPGLHESVSGVLLKRLCVFLACMSIFAPFALLERDRILSWSGYPGTRETVDSIFSSDANVERYVIGGWEPCSLVYTHYSYLCITLGQDHVVPLGCFVLVHTDAIDLACAVRRVLERLGVARDSQVRSLVHYDPRDSAAVRLMDADGRSDARAYALSIGRDRNVDVLTCLVLDLDASWRGVVKSRMSRARALQRIRATAERHVNLAGVPRLDLSSGPPARLARVVRLGY